MQLQFHFHFIFLDLQNSSYPTQSHSIIAKYPSETPFCCHPSSPKSLLIDLPEGNLLICPLQGNPLGN